MPAWQLRGTLVLKPRPTLPGEMSLASFALVLVLLSAVIHASWNIMARSSHSETRFIRQMLPFVAAVGFVPAVVGQLLAHSMSTYTWLYVAGSGLCCAMYFQALGKAYEGADFTTVYPVSRSLPVLIVALGDSLQGHRPSLAGWGGMALVVAGCMLAPLLSLRSISLSRYFNRASVWMVITALGTVGYTLFDKRSAEILKPGPVSAAVYCYFFYFFTFVAYWLIDRARGLPLGLSASGEEATGSTRAWMPAVAGSMSAGAYFLVLWALQLVVQASYVVAFRQSSLIIAVLMAFFFYREERHAMRLASVLVITAGLVLIKVLG
jgi:uncharacterized membrane protein